MAVGKASKHMGSDAPYSLFGNKAIVIPGKSYEICSGGEAPCFRNYIVRFTVLIVEKIHDGGYVGMCEIHNAADIRFNGPAFTWREPSI